jgi:hypothetical protein
MFLRKGLGSAYQLLTEAAPSGCNSPARATAFLLVDFIEDCNAVLSIEAVLRDANAAVEGKALRTLKHPSRCWIN